MNGVIEHRERLADVDPVLANFALNVPLALKGRWQVGRGATTVAEQGNLYAKGRTIKGEPPYSELRPLGRTVTNARSPAETAHGVRRYGACAVDFVALNDDGTPDWAPARYLELGAYAKLRGFEWGGDFVDPHTGKAMADLGHVQVPEWRHIPVGRITTT